MKSEKKNKTNLPQTTEERSYTVNIFLSDNKIVDENDIKIAELHCEAGSNSFACNSSGNIQCSYFLNGNNVLTCNSINLQGKKALINNVTPLVEYIDVLPKSTNIVVKSCLELVPSECFTNSKPLTLY